MITIIAGTNRLKSNSLNVAKSYQRILNEKGLESQIFDLSTLNPSFLLEDMYGNRTEGTQQIIDKFILPIKHFVFAIPEYNGTYPGVLKLFIDGMSPEFFHNKSACLVGVATGRAGNLRGLDAFTHVLNHIKMEVLGNKVLLSQVYALLDDEGYLKDEKTIEIIENQIDTFKRINRI
ncbi:MAG: NADPH-dependent FMN reductase [Flavobacteriales bacterium]